MSKYPYIEGACSKDFFFTDLVCNQKSLETMIWSIKFPSKDNFQSIAQCQELCLGIFFLFFFFF